MADTLKFGPEWLRALSDGTNVASPPPSPAVAVPAYKLAQYRYGREEMLALCTTGREKPDEMKEASIIISEKPLIPLALLPLTEDEQRLMAQSVNSTLVLRMMGRGSAPPGVRGGRGGLPDRGRGRGRGRGDGFYRSYEEDGFGRGGHGGPKENWEDGPGGRFDRGFPPGRTFEDEITSPPRREFSRSMSSDNWREAKKDEQEAGDRGAVTDDSGEWRKAPTRDRWGARGWRDPRERGGYDGYEGRGHYDDYRDKPPYERTRYPRTHSGSMEEGVDPAGKYLPEWSTADVEGMEDLGTFDSSGAFMSMKFEGGGDRVPGEKIVVRRPCFNNNDPDGASSSDTKEPARSEDSRPTPPSHEPKEAPKPVAKDKRSPETNGDVGKTTPKEERRNLSEQKPVTNTARSVVQPTAKKSQNEVKKTNSDSTKRLEAENIVSRPVVKQHKEMNNKTVENNANFDHLEKAAENLVATLGVEEEKEVATPSTPSIALPLDHEDAKKWFYKDPQGDLQGPFMPSEMVEWFSAGYFTMNLLVKRGCDERFHPLGELIKSWGRIPFIPGNSPPPQKNSSDASVVSSTPQPVVTPGVPLSSIGVAPHPPGGGLPTMAGLPTSLPAGLPLTAASMAGIAPAGLTLSAVTLAGMTPAAGLPLSAATMAGMTPAGLSLPADSQDQMKLLQQQQMIVQQQFMQQQLIRNMQIQQLITQLQSQPEFAAMSVLQQQQHAMNILVKQQMLLLQQQQTQQLPQAQQQQKLSPGSIQRSMSQPAESDRPTPQEDLPESIWGVGAPPPTTAPTPPVSSWVQPKPLWDIDPSKVKSLEQLEQQHREELEKVKQEEELLMNQRKMEEEKRKEQERRFKDEQESINRSKLEELGRIEMEKQEAQHNKAIERQREMERRQELERQRLEQLVREEEARRKQEEDQRRVMKEMEKQRRIEELRKHEEEMRRREEEQVAEEMRRQEQIRKEMEEQKRQEEILRRQEKVEEMRRQQQQEALKRLKQEHLGKIQLPANAQWGNASSNSMSGSSQLSLTQIQQMEAERDRQEAEREIQRQQMNAIQQQQQQLQGRSWASAAQSPPVTSSAAPSLLEIQQEQARQQPDKTVVKSPHQQPKQQAVPVATAAVWGGNAQSSTWAQDGAWGNSKTKATPGFWDEAVTATSLPTNVHTTSSRTENKKGLINNNSHFPSLGGVAPNNATSNGSRPAVSKGKAKSNKDEETVQRLFQNLKPKDEFTQWCENALKGIPSNVDVPTFVAFLIDVDSPYEVHDYARSYLGETRETAEFAHQFLEKRSKYKNHIRQQQQAEGDSIWGPAPAVNPNTSRSQANNNQNNSIYIADDHDAKNAKKQKKKKMQKVDQSFLGFTVHAAPDRINIGEIESGKVVE